MVVGDNDIIAIRDWLAKQPHIPQDLDDRLLYRFLRSCDSSLERTKTALEQFFTMRSDNSDLFKDRDPCSPKTQEILSKMELLSLDDLTPDGHSCLILRFLEKDMETFDLAEYAKVLFMVGDLQTREGLERVPEGLVLILDATNWNIKLFPKLPLMSLKRVFDYYQEGQPVKARQIHIINPLPFMDIVFSIMRPLVKSEIFDLVQIHSGGLDSLYQHVPRDILPQELGGHAGTVQDIKERLRSRLEAEREWLMKDVWMADESKRVGKRNGKLSTEMAGSFRTLSID